MTIGEPMPYPFSAFQLRQAVSELGAESEEVPRDEERTLHYQLAKHAKRHPFRVVFQDYEGKGLTLFQTLVGAVVLSRVIRRLVPDDVRYVGVFLPNMTVSAVSNLAVMMADKVPSPLNFSVSDETLRASIRKSGMTHILTSRRFLTALKREALPLNGCFNSREEAKRQVQNWLYYYNGRRPHSKLGMQSPNEYYVQLLNSVK